MRTHEHPTRSQTKRARQPERGFTLLELLVVLAIVGLISVVAVPQLSGLAARVEFALNRESLERSLRGLPYEAFKRHQDFILAEPTKRELGENGPLQVTFAQRETERKVTVEGPVAPVEAPIVLPQGWILNAPNPIIYRSTGLCSGGELQLTINRTVFRYDLPAPYCAPVEIP